MEHQSVTSYATACCVQKDATTLHVKGFASLAGLDRDMDNIDVTRFDVKTFMQNPQLWYNHRPWIRPDGNPVSIGVVEIAVIARAVVDGESIVIRDIAAEDRVAPVDTIKQVDLPSIMHGDVGLWVSCLVQEPDVADLVRDRRLNGFSWKGDLIRSLQTDEVMTIDLHEVSLVNLPANARCLFTVFKSAAFSIDAAACVLVWKGGASELGVGDVQGAQPVEDDQYAPYRVLLAKGEALPTTEALTAYDDASAIRAAARLLQTFPDVTRASVLHALPLQVPSAGQLHEVVMRLERGGLQKAKWTAAYINNLPDSAFAYIEPGGTKDASGKTVPRSKRHFPIRDAEGKLDRAHVLNALSRIPQSPFGPKARAKVEAAARKLGIHGGCKKELDAADVELLQLNAGIDAETEGGDDNVNTEELKGMTNAITALGDRIAVLEQKQVAPPPADPAPETPAAQEEAAEVDGGEDAEEDSAVVKALMGLTDGLKALDVRLQKMEDAAATPAAAALEAAAQTVAKSRAQLPETPAQRSARNRQMLGDTLVPCEVRQAHRIG